MASKSRLNHTFGRSVGVLLAVIGVFALLLVSMASAPQNPVVLLKSNDPTPVLAYYYIWFDPGSWDRAKTDYPTLGRYSSDDGDVMRQHIQWAKQAGINGFIVSWKSTDKLNPRLDKLVAAADAENFKLAIIYQGLDFQRDPLPADKIAADLDFFIARYADHPAFHLYDKPVVIWSGTWKFSREDVVKVAEPRRHRLLILASEKNVKGYERIADTVDGDAYYWSSVNPDTFSGYEDKLNSMSQAVHAHQGLWVAPAAPGFDARLIGGKTVLDRRDGAVLRQEMDAALNSSPDAIGLISWNEFSENSYIEPSVKYGRRYLDVLADIRHTSPPVLANFDSSEPEGIRTWQLGSVAALVFLLSLFVASTILITTRHRLAH